MANKGNRHLNSFANDVFDAVEYRNRVATFVDGSTVSYEDNNFSTGDSPAILDVFTDLGRIGHDGYLVNDGPGNILLEISADGTAYGGQHTIRSKEILSLKDSAIKKIRLTWAQNTAYRVLVA